MMAGNPNWWSSMHPPSLFPSQYVQLGSSNSLPLNSLPEHNLEPPQSWSQLLLGGLSSQEDGFGTLSHFQPKGRLENWEEDQILIPQYPRAPVVDFIKQESSSQNSINLCNNPHGDEEFQLAPSSRPVWSPVQIMPVSSPRSCVTSLSNNNILDFSYNKADNKRNQHADHSSECNSTATGGMCKKARVQPSPSQPPLKVRKEKLGDRITALHQLVSPFGKTDTASVLLEAIGYIRFLQGQIEALSSPYLGNASKNMRNQQSVQGERNCVFPEDPGQLLNDNCLKRKGAPNQHPSSQDKAKDLRSKGLCLVPVSCTQHVGSDNGADYWAPAYGSGF
ncbi:PREDICTED: mRNAion factor [Prunus dulcis]|uniref:PREDICTED: mRNAion factor n=1 Tax=Prunus dulcis TaxID=3755 RepID=A0A5E4ESM1_PRUDU|nr:transcription factor bHLH68-like isoform X1 [Prunus dulcis]VVA18694.1 PREDICTED: mRNAion factor [Prunus dulcis]